MKCYRTTSEKITKRNIHKNLYVFTQKCCIFAFFVGTYTELLSDRCSRNVRKLGQIYRDFSVLTTYSFQTIYLTLQ